MKIRKLRPKKVLWHWPQVAVAVIVNYIRNMFIVQATDVLVWTNFESIVNLSAADNLSRLHHFCDNKQVSYHP